MDLKKVGRKFILRNDCVSCFKVGEEVQCRNLRKPDSIVAKFL